MRRVILLLVFIAAACGPANTGTPTLPPLVTPPTDTAAPATETPTLVPPSETPTQTLTSTPAPPSGFPNSDNYQWAEVISGFARPVDIQNAGDGSGRLFIVEQFGRIRIFQNGQILETPFLEINDRVDDARNEQGLLGLAFHPDYEQNGFFYVNYTMTGGDTIIARFQVTSDPNVADPNSEKQLLMVDQPFANHNGGVLTFGPDGYLYAGLGDGGSGGDPMDNGQSLETLLGKILRIDVDNGDPYVIPPDNPFGNEIWAYGLRNPWRMSFDSETHDIWIGDVGQGQWEEIDYLPAGSPGGANFGWSILEGTHPYKGDPQPDFIMPVVEYSHDEGCSVTGGYVYRGSMPEWQGIYIYADYCTGFVWGLIPSANGWQSERLFETGVQVTTFGVDETDELYLASLHGKLLKLMPKEN